MTDHDNQRCADRLLLALDLAESGLEIRRAQLRRQFPEDSDRQIDERLLSWRLNRADAPHGDCPGTPIDPATILES